MRQLLTAMLCAMSVLGAARAQERVSLGLDWAPGAENGGYFQAQASGIYRKYGLEVTIRPGGSQTSPTRLAISGEVDFAVLSDSFQALNALRQNLPFRVVAAIYQRDPSVLIAYPGQGNDSFAALRGKPIMISPDTRAGWWGFLRAKFGYSDAQTRPYSLDMAPFLADKQAIQQGIVSVEPFLIRRAIGAEPVVLAVADAEFPGYAGLIGTADRNIRERAGLVRRFINASIEGWYGYLYGDPGPANTAIRAANPAMTPEQLDFGRTALLRNRIVDAGDTLSNGIGAMTDLRWANFLRAVALAGLYSDKLNVRRAYTLQFVNRRVGMELKK